MSDIQSIETYRAENCLAAIYNFSTNVRQSGFPSEIRMTSLV